MHAILDQHDGRADFLLTQVINQIINEQKINCFLRFIWKSFIRNYATLDPDDPKMEGFHDKMEAILGRPMT